MRTKPKRTKLEPFLRQVEKNVRELAAGRPEAVTTTRSLAAWFVSMVASELENGLAREYQRSGKNFAEKVAQRMIEEAMNGTDPITAGQVIVEMTERIQFHKKDRLQ